MVLSPAAAEAKRQRVRKRVAAIRDKQRTAAKLVAKQREARAQHKAVPQSCSPWNRTKDGGRGGRRALESSTAATTAAAAPAVAARKWPPVVILSRRSRRRRRDRVAQPTARLGTDWQAVDPDGRLARARYRGPS